MFLPPPPLPRGALKGVGGNQPPLVGLPPNLRAMFDPITPLEFKPPVQRNPTVPISGIASYVKEIETTPAPKPKPFIPPTEAKKMAQERLQKLHQEKNELLAQDWDPHGNTRATSNAFATVFVSRLSFDTNEKKLRREFELYGPIRSIRVVTDLEGKSRGYAFVEYENEKDAETAVRKSEGKRIDGRRILCDVERGRTVKNWRPMRLGGGVGGRAAKKSKKQLEEEAEKAAAAANAANATSGGAGSASTDRYGGGNSSSNNGGGGGSSARGRSRSRDRRGRPDSRERDARGQGWGGGGGRRADSSRDRDHRDRDHRGAPRRDRDSRDRVGTSSNGGGSGGGGGGHYGPSSSSSSSSLLLGSNSSAAYGQSNGGGGGRRADHSRDRFGGGGSYRGRSRERR